MRPKEGKVGKGELTRRRILQSARYCLAHYGEREATFQKIADHCGVSQPLVVHYFKSRDNIFRFVLEDFLSQARGKTEQALRADLSPEDKLKDYFRVSVALFRDEPEWARVYLMLYYISGYSEEYRAINSEVKRVAVKRVAAILREGVDAGVFETANIEVMAKTIHMNLTGLVLNILTESQTFPDNVLVKSLEDSTLRALRPVKPGAKVGR